MILAIRTDKPESELYLLDNNGAAQADMLWQAHRQLAATLHKKIGDLLQSQNVQLADLNGILFYAGPGSFTGLRIGAATVNSLADSFELPVGEGQGEDWLQTAFKQLQEAPKTMAVPHYGSAPHITTPRK